jgi:hypothetical protein
VTSKLMVTLQGTIFVDLSMLPLTLVTMELRLLEEKIPHSITLALILVSNLILMIIAILETEEMMTISSYFDNKLL